MYISPGAKPPTIVATRAPTATCPNCGMIKSGKLSCCAPDGAWAKNCGSGDSRFDHTWAEGIRACKNELSRK